MESATRRLAEEVAAALTKWARSSSVRATGKPEGASDVYRLPGRGVSVGEEETLVFDIQNERTDLSLPQLAHILDNSAKNAGYAYEAFDELWEWVRENSEAVDEEGIYVPRSIARKRASIQRNLVVLKTCLAQASALVQGKDLDVEALPGVKPSLALSNLSEPMADVGRHDDNSTTGDRAEEPVGDPELGTYEVKPDQTWEAKEAARLEGEQHGTGTYVADTADFRVDMNLMRELAGQQEKLPHVYSMIKAHQAELRNSELPVDHQTATRLQEVLDYIKGE